MYSIIVFIITLAELIVVAGGHYLHSQHIVYNALVYGSPFYLVMNLLNSESAFLDKSPLYIGLLLFHLVKYFLFFKARASEEKSLLFYAAVLCEAAYLGLSAYYIN